jgi:hypothetical protein
VQERLERLEMDLDLVSMPPEDDEEPRPDEILLESFEMGIPVELHYAAAGGTVVEHVTVEELDGARFLVEDAETGDRRWRWNKGVLAARLTDD